MCNRTRLDAFAASKYIGCEQTSVTVVEEIHFVFFLIAPTSFFYYFPRMIGLTAFRFCHSNIVFRFYTTPYLHEITATRLV